jgi:hypothetical protein
VFLNYCRGREIEYRLDILRATKGAHVEVVFRSIDSIGNKIFVLRFHIPDAVILFLSV